MQHESDAADQPSRQPVSKRPRPQPICNLFAIYVYPFQFFSLFFVDSNSRSNVSAQLLNSDALLAFGSAYALSFKLQPNHNAMPPRGHRFIRCAIRLRWRVDHLALAVAAIVFWSARWPPRALVRRSLHSFDLYRCIPFRLSLLAPSRKALAG